MTRQALCLTDRHWGTSVRVFLQHVLYIKEADDGKAATLALSDGSSLDVCESVDEIFRRIYG